MAKEYRSRRGWRSCGRTRVPCDQRKVLKLHAAGCSLGEIAKTLKLTKTTVYRIIHAKEGKLAANATIGKATSGRL